MTDIETQRQERLARQRAKKLTGADWQRYKQLRTEGYCAATAMLEIDA